MEKSVVQLVAAGVAFTASLAAGAIGFAVSFIGFEDSSYPYEGWSVVLYLVGLAFFLLSAWLVYRATGRRARRETSGSSAPPPQ